MQSPEIRSHATLGRKAELFDALSIMLMEASSRINSREAAYVISGILENLSRDYPEVKDLAQSWAELANL
ncbi:TPA: hypothetical protein ACGWNK_004347 [Salmonella enterica]|uniref:hypothetical protein n=1 Tax=Gammaproteobacteria TaxID=1236 RepID=UPI00107B0188|nr:MULTISPECIES: hypothetical protein [Gammaproteobacteria]EAB9607385.1 hypothetical protein [Salmonella enterica subsp. enterica serovar Infantis]ECU8224376.1 hypothetical protein [Salmonella enterica subsp. enterica serovar Thompson]EFB1672091.1 hypothetical protein [Escherichia coli]EFF6323014.1 hypothetical protein [Escherichia coli]EGK3607941.1 hypothetical protein [Escherichia coli]